ncbi:hypothetical protein ABPG72_017506 [Tetrahymena utriculariae]
MDQSQIVNKEQSLDTKKLINLFKESAVAQNNVRDKNIIILVGPTGSGKSTTANYLLGCQMYENHIKQIKEINGRSCEIEYEVIDSYGNFEIGHSTQSHTLALQIAQLKNNCFLCDSPGFFDNRGAEIEIVNASSLNQFIASCASMRMVVLISYFELVAQRGALFKDIFELITRILKRPQKEQFDKITFLFTKVPQEKKVSSIIKEVVGFSDALKQEDSFQKQMMMDLLTAILDQLQSNSISIVNPLDNNHEELVQKILNQALFENPSEEFCFSISEKSTQKICLYVEETINSVLKKQSKGQYDKVMEDMIEFKQLKDLIASDYLIGSYQDLQNEIAKNFEKQRHQAFKIFKEASERSNIFCNQNMQEIDQILKYLRIIDVYKERVFEEGSFQISEHQFKQEIEGVCSEIGQRIARDFPSNIESVKNHLQKLKDFSEQTSLGAQTYNQSQRKIKDKYKLDYDDFVKLSKQLHERINYLDLDKMKKDVSQIAQKVDFFKQIDQFISNFVLEAEQQNTYELLVKEQQEKNKELVQSVKTIIIKINKEIQDQPNFFDSDLLFNPKISILPDFEINLLKILYQNIQYSVNIPDCEKNLDEALQDLKDFNQQVFDFIKENSKDDFQLFKLENILKILDSIRNLDDLILGKTIEEYKQIKDQIKQKLFLKAAEGKEILQRYSEEFYEELEEEEKINEENGKINVQNQKKDFNKLKKILQFLNSMLWTDSYFKIQFTHCKISKLERKLNEYLLQCKVKIDCLTENEDYFKIKYFLQKMSIMGIFQINNFDEQLNACKQSIIEKVAQKNEVIEVFITNMEQETKFNISNWKTINEHVQHLKKTQILDTISEVKANSEKIMRGIANIIRTFYMKNFYSIEQLSQGQVELNDSDYMKYSEFAEQVKIISLEYNDIQQLAQGYSYAKLNELVKKIYDKMVFDYLHAKQQQEDLQEIQASFDKIKRFIRYMSQFDFLSAQFNSLPTPKEAIQSAFKNLESLIRNGEFENLDYEIQVLNKLQNERDKQTLGNYLEKLYDKLSYLIKQIINMFQFQKNKQIDYSETLCTNFTSIQNILKLLKKYQVQLFSQAQIDLSQFLLDFSKTYMKNQKQQIINFLMNFQFKEMEKQYDCLESIIGYLSKFKKVFNQDEWNTNIQNQLDDIALEMEKNVATLHDKNNLKNLQKLHYELEQAQKLNSGFLKTYQDEIVKTKNKIQQLFECYENNIQDQIKKQDFNYQSQLKVLKDFCLQDENRDDRLYNDCCARVQRIEEFISEESQKLNSDIQKHLENGNFKEVIDQLKQQKKQDSVSFQKVLKYIQGKIQSSISLIKDCFPNIEVQCFQNNLKTILSSMSIVDKFKKEIDQIQENDQVIIQLSNYLIGQSNKLFNDCDRILNGNEESFTPQIFQILFKHELFFKILKEELNETEQLKQARSHYEMILKKLLQNLEKTLTSQKLVKETMQVNSGLIRDWKKFDSLLQLLKNDSLFGGSQELKMKIKQIGEQIETYEAIFKFIKTNFENNIQTFSSSLQACDFVKVKEIIFILRKQSSLNKEFNFEFVDINELLKQVESKVAELTKEAVDIVKASLVYDQKMNVLVNNIYKADEHLKGIEQFSYESQMQKVCQELANKLDEQIQTIPSVCLLSNSNLDRVGHIIISIQKVSEQVSKFVQIVDKKLFEAVDLIQQILGEEVVFELGNRFKEDPSMAQVVNKIPQFKLYKVEKFNDLVGKHSINYVLGKMEISLKGSSKQPLSQKEKEELINYYKIYETKYEETMNGYKFKKEKWQEIIEQIKLRSKSINFNKMQQEKKAVLDMLAQICAYWALDESGEQRQGKKNIFKRPNHTQILSIIMLLGINKEKGFWKGVQSLINFDDKFYNQLIEILTGEGKSLVLGFCSITLALLGCEVDVVCYSNYLSDRDNKDFRKLFEIFGVSEKISYGTFDEQANKFLNKDLNIRNAAQNLIKQNKQIKSSKRQDCKSFRILLIDEVDIFFNQDYYGQTYNPIANFKNTEIEAIIRDIWDKREQSSDEITQSVTTSLNYTQLISQYPKFEKYFQNQICQLAKDVKKVKSHKQKSNYVVRNNQIGYRKKDSSVSFCTHSGYKTLFCYFYENTLGNIDDQSLQSKIQMNLHCGNISYAYIPDSYSAILGVTGTLKSLNKQMKQCLKKYNIQTEIYTPSMFGDSKLVFNKGDMVKVETDQENQYMQIQNISKEAVQKEQSVLIFFKDSQSLKNYHESSYTYFASKDDYVVVTEHENNEDVDFNVKRVTQSGQIGLFVREYGRGTDFICLDPKVDKAGGVVVIQTFLSESITEEIQIRGRTARQGQCGQYYLILNQNDIEKDFKITQQQIQEWKDNQMQKSLYSHLDQVRNDLEENTYSNIELRIQQATEQHQKSIKFFEDIQNQNYESAISYIIENS